LAGVLPTVPDRNPRTECACQPVNFISSFKVTPSGRFSRSSTLDVLLPSRAATAIFWPVGAFFWPLGAFLAGLAFLVALAFFGAAWAPFLATAAFGYDFWIFHLPKQPRYGFWSMMHEAGADFDMLLGSLYLLIEGAGAWSLDAMLACGSGYSSLRRLRL
jgi:hypothetical protein